MQSDHWGKISVKSSQVIWEWLFRKILLDISYGWKIYYPYLTLRADRSHKSLFCATIFHFMQLSFLHQLEGGSAVTSQSTYGDPIRFLRERKNRSALPLLVSDVNGTWYKYWDINIVKIALKWHKRSKELRNTGNKMDGLANPNQDKYCTFVHL